METETVVMTEFASLIDIALQCCNTEAEMRPRISHVLDVIEQVITEGEVEVRPVIKLKHKNEPEVGEIV